MGMCLTAYPPTDVPPTFWVQEVEEDKLSFMGAFCSHDCAMGFIETIKELPSVTPKAESCEDAISRQAVHDIWHTTYPTVRIGNEEIQYKKIAYDLPFVTPQQTRWIPCSERLPKENEYIGNVCKYYLIQDEYGDMHVAHLSNVGWIPMDSLKAIGDEIIAWMPLPEPYKAESEEE